MKFELDSSSSERDWVSNFIAIMPVPQSSTTGLNQNNTRMMSGNTSKVFNLVGTLKCANIVISAIAVGLMAVSHEEWKPDNKKENFYLAAVISGLVFSIISFAVTALNITCVTHPPGMQGKIKVGMFLIVTWTFMVVAIVNHSEEYNKLMEGLSATIDFQNAYDKWITKVSIATGLGGVEMILHLLLLGLLLFRSYSQPYYIKSTP